MTGGEIKEINHDLAMIRCDVTALYLDRKNMAGWKDKLFGILKAIESLERKVEILAKEY